MQEDDICIFCGRDEEHCTCGDELSVNEPKRSTDIPSKKAVRCPKCGRFLFNIEITMDSPPVGNIGSLSDFSCPNRRCGYKSMILIGVAEKDERDGLLKIEDEMRKQINESEE